MIGFSGYGELKDPLQRDRALQAGSFARERTKGLRNRTSLVTPPWTCSEQVQGERMAWLALLEGLLGLNILVALRGSDQPDRCNLLHRRLNSELHYGLKGFITAFPGEIVEQDLDRLCGVVIDQACMIADHAWREVRHSNEEQIDGRAFLCEEWTREIRPNLMSHVRGEGVSGQ